MREWVNVWCTPVLVSTDDPTDEDIASRQAAYEIERARAYDAWYDGECCGHTDEWNGRCKYCPVCPCYVMDEEGARQYWDEIEQVSNLISPWRRAENVAAFIRESAL